MKFLVQCVLVTVQPGSHLSQVCLKVQGCVFLVPIFMMYKGGFQSQIWPFATQVALQVTKPFTSMRDEVSTQGRSYDQNQK